MAIRKLEAKAQCLVNLMVRMKCEHNDPTRFVKDQIDNVFICLQNDIKWPWNDWTLKVTDSSIPNAGRGVFLNGHAPAGRLLCFYGGELWRSEDIESAISKVQSGDIHAGYDLDQLLIGQYTYSRDNGSLIDGTPSDEIHAVLRENPLCLGYCINHPPIGMAPNLLPLDAPFSFDKKTMKYKPTWNRAQDFVDDQITIFLAMKDIQNGEELFFDYDLDVYGEDEKKDGLPSWYHSIDPAVYEQEM